MHVIEQEISKLEKEAEALDLTGEQIRSMYESLADNSSSFLSELSDLEVFSDNKEISLDLQKEADPEVAISQVFEEFKKSGLQAASHGHLAYIPGGGLTIGAIADAMAATINQFSADSNASPAASKINDQAIRWLCDSMGYSPEANGDITSGGSIATLTAITVAKKHHNIDIHNQLHSVIYMSEHTHHCINKAISIVFGEQIDVRYVKLDKDLKLDACDLENKIKADIKGGKNPFMIIANAGTTNLGKVDALNVIADLSEEHGIWMHVDGAYGGFFKIADKTSHLFAGIERADSIVLDPHKTMFLPYGSGAVLLKKGFLLEKTFSSNASYLQDSQRDCSFSPMDKSIELSRPFRSLRVWLAIKLYGRDTIAAALSEKHLLAKYMTDKLKHFSAVEILTEPDLSIVSFKLATDEKSQKLISLVNQTQKFHLSSTTINGEFIIRVAIVSFRTHKKHIDDLLSIIETSLNTMGRETKNG